MKSDRPETAEKKAARLQEFKGAQIGWNGGSICMY